MQVSAIKILKDLCLCSVEIHRQHTDCCCLFWCFSRKLLDKIFGFWKYYLTIFKQILIVIDLQFEWLNIHNHIPIIIQRYTFVLRFVAIFCCCRISQSCISTEIPATLETFHLKVKKKKKRVVFLNINTHKHACCSGCSKKGREKVVYVDYMLWAFALAFEATLFSFLCGSYKQTP